MRRIRAGAPWIDPLRAPAFILHPIDGVSGPHAAGGVSASACRGWWRHWRADPPASPAGGRMHRRRVASAPKLLLFCDGVPRPARSAFPGGVVSSGGGVIESRSQPGRHGSLAPPPWRPRPRAFSLLSSPPRGPSFSCSSQASSPSPASAHSPPSPALPRRPSNSKKSKSKMRRCECIRQFWAAILATWTRSSALCTLRWGARIGAGRCGTRDGCVTLSPARWSGGWWWRSCTSSRGTSPRLSVSSGSSWQRSPSSSGLSMWV